MKKMGAKIKGLLIRIVTVLFFFTENELTQRNKLNISA